MGELKGPYAYTYTYIYIYIYIYLFIYLLYMFICMATEEQRQKESSVCVNGSEYSMRAPSSSAYHQNSTEQRKR